MTLHDSLITEEDEEDRPRTFRKNLKQITLPPQKNSHPVRKKRHVAIALGVMVALLVCGAMFEGKIKMALDAFTAKCKELGWIAVVVYGLLVAVLNLIMFPTFPLMMGAGVLFPAMYGNVMGQIIGVGSVFGGLWTGSMCAFYLGRTLLQGWAKQELDKFAWMRVINAMIDEQGWWVVLLARMSPLVPAEVFNYACALTSLSFPSYAIGCVGSLFPVSVWVITAAATQQAGQAATEDMSSSAQQGGGNSMFFLAFNVVFLIFLSSLLYCAVRKYKEKAKPAIEKHVRIHGAHLDEDEKSRRQILLARSISNLSVHPDLHHDNLFSKTASNLEAAAEQLVDGVEDKLGEAAAKCVVA
eukprot:TRINITY_DN72500_c0_g1_i1.p1 TRINITY_DN72500_c0_g1~~TRINITY_DN72500_c0_g1_i1.p1  ORF type:complete len:356 (-),score=96.01 TRINITY_DN72500_c0_g1_i1:315-1382(-)